MSIFKVFSQNLKTCYDTSEAQKGGPENASGVSEQGSSLSTSLVGRSEGLSLNSLAVGSKPSASTMDIPHNVKVESM